MGFWSAGTMPRDFARDKPRACFRARWGVARCIGAALAILSRQLRTEQVAMT